MCFCKVDSAHSLSPPKQLGAAGVRVPPWMARELHSPRSLLVDMLACCSATSTHSFEQVAGASLISRTLRRLPSPLRHPSDSSPQISLHGRPPPPLLHHFLLALFTAFSRNPSQLITYYHHQSPTSAVLTACRCYRRYRGQLCQPPRIPHTTTATPSSAMNILLRCTIKSTRRKVRSFLNKNILESLTSCQETDMPVLDDQMLCSKIRTMHVMVNDDVVRRFYLVR